MRIRQHIDSDRKTRIEINYFIRKQIRVFFNLNLLERQILINFRIEHLSDIPLEAAPQQAIFVLLTDKRCAA